MSNDAPVVSADYGVGRVYVEWGANSPDCRTFIRFHLSPSRARRLAVSLSESAREAEVEATPPASTTVADRVRDLRGQLGLSQEYVAARMVEQGFSWHQATVYKVEADSRRLLFDEAIALAPILGVSLDALAGGRS